MPEWFAITIIVVMSLAFIAGVIVGIKERDFVEGVSVFLGFIGGVCFYGLFILLFAVAVGSLSN